MLIDAEMEEVILAFRALPQISSKDEQTKVIRELRDLPPIHYLFKIKNFSRFSNVKVDHYESTDFEIGGYQCIRTRTIYGLRAATTTAKHPPKESPKINLVQFPETQKQHSLVTAISSERIADRLKKIANMMQKWGFDQLLPLSVFNDASNGYLINDCCVFGAEVFVLEGSSKGECASTKELDNNSYTWKIEDFTWLVKETYNSEEFVVGGHRWKIELHPDWYEQGFGNSLSVYLNLAEEDTLDPEHSICAEYVLRVVKN